MVLGGCGRLQQREVVGNGVNWECSLLVRVVVAHWGYCW